MAGEIDELYRLKSSLQISPLCEHADVETARLDLKSKIERAIELSVPAELLALEREHGFSNSLEAALKAYEKFGLYAVEPTQDMLMTPRQLRDTAPGMGAIIEALNDRPELQEKVAQGFTRVLPVPIGLPCTAFVEPMKNAVAEYRAQGKLRSSAGESIELDSWWVNDVYEGADRSGVMVYEPECFESDCHNGKSKQQVLDTSKIPGWQVLLIEDLPEIPRQGHGKMVNGRPQIEASNTPDECLAWLQSRDCYKHEQGLTPEAWQALFLSRLAETDGKMLESGFVSNAHCLGAYLPGEGDRGRSWCIPSGSFNKEKKQLQVATGWPTWDLENVGVRVAVRVL